jgi:outer membrane protein assembly factor BamB
MKRLTVLLLLLFTACRNDKPVWQLSLESRSYAQPVIDGDSVYVISEAGEVIASNYRTGTKLWKQKLGAPIFGDPAVSEQLLYAGTEKGELAAFDKKSGAQRWRKDFPNNSFVSPLTVHDDTLFAPSRTGVLYALQTKTGDTIWTFTDAKVLMAGVAIRDPYVLIGGWDRSMDCLDLKTGDVKWRFQIDEPIVGTALVTNNQVIFGGHEHAFWALDIPTGKLLWKRDARLHSNGVLLENQFVYGIRNVLCVVDSRNGTVLRQVQTKGNIDSVYNRDGRIIVLSKNKMYRIDVDTLQSTLLLSTEQPFYRAAFPPGMTIVSDQLYTVRGYRQE